MRAPLREPVQENLLDELTRLVGRPLPMVHAALSHAMRQLTSRIDPRLLAGLAPFPMTSWRSLACDASVAELWEAAAISGLTTEEVLTTFAVLDDHVRRAYGDDAWCDVRSWGPRVVGLYDLHPLNVGTGRREATAPHLS